jgi:hypothetical protein
MSRHEGRFGRREFAIDNMQIGAANTTGADADKNLSFAGIAGSNPVEAQ